MVESSAIIDQNRQIDLNVPSDLSTPTTTVGGDVDIVAGITKLGEQVAGNMKLE